MILGNIIHEEIGFDNNILDDLDSSTFAKAFGVMGFEGATKGTFKYGLKKQVKIMGFKYSVFGGGGQGPSGKLTL